MLARVPNPYDDEDRRRERVEAQLEQTTSRRSLVIFVGGWIILGVFGLLVWSGLPGSGVLLVPIGLGMILGGGLELVLGHLGP
jgi:hypothetical protein